jgi:hypothetical protein
VYNQREPFICLNLMVKNRELPIERYFKWWTDTKLVWVMGEGRDTPSVTVAASVFYITSTVQSTLYLRLSSLSKLNLSFEYY